MQLSELPEVITNRSHIRYKKGDYAFSSDETIKNFYFILDGKIKISHVNPDTAKEQTIKILKRGDMFDIVTLLDNKEHEYISTALQDSTVITLPIDAARKLLESSQEFRSYFFTYTANELRDLENLAVDLALYDVEERLIHLFKREFATQDGSILDGLTHEEIAALVGSVRKVVNRKLQKLKKDGIVDIKRQKIEYKK